MVVMFTLLMKMTLATRLTSTWNCISGIVGGPYFFLRQNFRKKFRCCLGYLHIFEKMKCFVLSLSESMTFCHVNLRNVIFYY